MYGVTEICNSAGNISWFSANRPPVAAEDVFPTNNSCFQAQRQNRLSVWFRVPLSVESKRRISRSYRVIETLGRWAKRGARNGNDRSERRFTDCQIELGWRYQLTSTSGVCKRDLLESSGNKMMRFCVDGSCPTERVGCLTSCDVPGKFNCHDKSYWVTCYISGLSVDHSSCVAFHHVRDHETFYRAWMKRFRKADLRYNISPI